MNIEIDNMCINKICSYFLLGYVIWEYENVCAHAASLFQELGSWLNSEQIKIISEQNLISKWWNSLEHSEKIFYPIFAANILVYGAWHVESLHPYLIKYFLTKPAGSAVILPMVLSIFSHDSLNDLAANMYILYTFMPAAVSFLGKEQFVAMYLSAGVISNLASISYKVALNQPSLGHGASGSVMSVLSFVFMQYPDIKFRYKFLQMYYSFTAGSAIKVIMVLELVGILLGWKDCDHVVHLGGVLFGIAWCHWGNHIWEIWTN